MSRAAASAAAGRRQVYEFPIPAAARPGSVRGARARRPPRPAFMMLSCGTERVWAGAARARTSRRRRGPPGRGRSVCRPQLRTSPPHTWRGGLRERRPRRRDGAARRRAHEQRAPASPEQRGRRAGVPRRVLHQLFIITSRARAQPAACAPPASRNTRTTLAS